MGVLSGGGATAKSGGRGTCTFVRSCVPVQVVKKI